MKKSLSTILALALVFPIAALAQGTMKIGTVDMQRAFKEYNKTKEAEVKINDAKNSARKEYDDRAESYKKALDEINNLNKQLESPALSAISSRSSQRLLIVASRYRFACSRRVAGGGSSTRWMRPESNPPP